jgi:hypothetical protein
MAMVLYGWFMWFYNVKEPRTIKINEYECVICYKVFTPTATAMDIHYGEYPVTTHCVDCYVASLHKN